MNSRNLLYNILLCPLLPLLVAGCNDRFYKDSADREVLTILDEKWSDKYGTRANLRVLDVEPTPDDLPVVSSLPENSTLSLARAVAIATANNRNYQLQREGLYQEALDLSLQRHDFTLQFFGRLSGDYINDHVTEDIQIQIPDGDDQDTDPDIVTKTINHRDDEVRFSNTFGFNLLLASGARLGVSLANNWSRFFNSDPQSTLGSALQVSLTQPLLRGAGKKIAQENLTQAERDVMYEMRSFSRFRRRFVVDVVSEYFDVLQAYDQLKNDEFNYRLRIDSTQRATMLVQAGRQQRIEADQARQSELSARNNLVRSRQNYQRELDNFKLTLALPLDSDLRLDPNELTGLRGVLLNEPNVPEQDAIALALVHRLDLATSRDQVEDARRRLEVARNNLLIRFDVSGSYSAASDSTVRSTDLEFRKGRFELGLDLDLDLDRKAERNALRNAQISLTQRQRAYDEAVDLVKFSVRDALRRLKEASQSYQIQLQSVKLAEIRVDSTNMLLQAGRADTRDLLESQDDLLSAQNSLTSAIIDYTIAELTFYRDIGLLQVRPDGLWEQADETFLLSKR